MPDPIDDDPAAPLGALQLVWEAARTYVPAVADRPAAAGSARAAAAALDRAPGPGVGAVPAVATLIDAALGAATASTGPRYYDFVVGGATPAAMAADWLTALLDQNAAGPGSAEWATELETVVLRQLVALLGLPASWSGVLTSSAMLGSFAALTCATQWWGGHYGIDVAERGLAGLPPMPVFATPLVHPAVRKALQMLGHGRGCVRVVPAGGEACVDLARLERSLAEQDGPAVLVVTAGDASAGRFDPLAALAEVAERHGAWLHVDGAFGVYVALSSRARHLVAGIERADSIAADAHKWMNVPYESGYCLLREPALLEQAFGMPAAPYLPGPDDGFRGYAVRGPESSRRARALAIWASIAAYGRDGLGRMVERHLDVTRHLAERVRAQPELELLEDPVSCIACFRWTGTGTPAGDLNARNRALARAIADDGRFALGTTELRGVIGLRAALCNWQVRREHVDELVGLVLELAPHARPRAR